MKTSIPCYYDTHKDLYKKRYAGYREAYLTKVTCECGAKVSRMNLSQHKKCTKHKKRMIKPKINK